MTRRGWILPIILAAACAADEETSLDVNPSASDEIRAGMPPCGTVLGSFDGTAAYSNGANTGTGVSCAGAGSYGLRYQCVELVMRHFQTHWGMRWWGNARDLLNNAPRDRVEVFYNGDRAHPPVPGDLIVWQTGTWGHTALVTNVRAGAVDILEQNVGGGARSSLPYDGARIGSRWGDWAPQGWGHARANRRAPPPPPPPSCPRRCDGDVSVAADCARTDCAASGAVCREEGGAHCVPIARGSLDEARCDEIRGWAQDPNARDAVIEAELFFDGPADANRPSLRVRADLRRDDLCAALGSCDHAFAIDTPLALRDGRAHTVYAYGRSLDGLTRPLLGGAPKSLRCTAPRVTDFNGDGRADLVQHRGDARTLPVCVSLGSGWSCRNLAADAGDWRGGNEGSALLADAVPLLGRFNDDAHDDLVMFRADTGRVPVCLSLGSGWSCRGLVAGYAGEGAAGVEGSGVYAQHAPMLFDMNGDGRTDLVQHRAGADALPVCLSLATGWSCRDLPASGLSGAPLAGDFDGDGRGDVIHFDPARGMLPVCLSLGTGWSCRDLPANLAGTSSPGVFAGATPLVGDFNGDGRADLVQYRPGATSTPVCLSLATGWSCRDLPSALPAPTPHAAVSAHLADFDGDGRADLVQYDPRGRTLPVCLSLGTGWSCRDLPASFADPLGEPGNEGSGIYRGGQALVGDFNGDGRADILQYQSRAWSAIPVCLSLRTGWTCRPLQAFYAGGMGEGNSGSGVY